MEVPIFLKAHNFGFPLLQEDLKFFSFIRKLFILRLKIFIFFFTSLFLKKSKSNLSFLSCYALKPMALTEFNYIFLCTLVTTIFVNGVSPPLSFLKVRIVIFLLNLLVQNNFMVCLFINLVKDRCNSDFAQKHLSKERAFK